MEALYLFPEELLFQGGFQEMAQRLFEKEKNDYSYLTGIVYKEPFTLKEFPQIVKKLYRKLDLSIVIGENQLIRTDRETLELKRPDQGQGQLEQIEYLIRYKEDTKLLDELKRLFSLWEEEKSGQLSVEASVRYIIQLLRNSYPSEKNYADLEFLMDDAFYYALNMQELSENILTLVNQCVPALAREKTGDKELLFRSIQSYIHGHLEEAMTLGSICRQFGVSQTSLSKMFRIYEETSFSSYLTKVRIDTARQMMRQSPDAYIKDIAERVGYGDQFYFSRIFRSVTGVCPREYMEKYQAGAETAPA